LFELFFTIFLQNLSSKDAMQQQRRKVSSLSDRSDNSEQGAASGGEEESPGILSDDQVPDSPNESNDSDETSKNFPWMRSVIAIINSFNYYCTHQNYCHPYCYKRHVRAAGRLIKAIRKVSQWNMKLFHFQLEHGRCVVLA
jgi:protein unc-80